MNKIHNIRMRRFEKKNCINIYVRVPSFKRRIFEILIGSFTLQKDRVTYLKCCVQQNSDGL